MQNLDINSEQFNNLSDTEKQAVLEILNEYNKDGTSQLYNDLLYYDYEEIPVTINEFLHNDLYLGKALIDDEGKYSIFPYWEKILNQIFPTNLDTNYNTAVFTGAIGLGKSTIAVIGVLYELYRMMCLKNPYKHYGLQEIDLITFAFINITLDAARGVAWDKCQQMIQKSKWFLDRGSLTKSSNPTWKPPKGIELITGSNPGHILGRALFACLDGDTEIATVNGDIKISQLINKNIQVKSIDKNGNICLSDLCTIQATKKSIEEYQIELEDGTIIKCTPEHLFMLKDGTYKQAKYLTESDELFDITMSYQDYINSIIQSRGQWNIETGKYFEGHHIIPKCLGGNGNPRKKDENIIWLYPQEHFIAHKLLAIENPYNTSLVLAWSMMAFPKGKTERNLEISPYEYAQLRQMQSKLISKNNPFLKNGIPWNKGKTNIYNIDTINKIKNSKFGKKLSLSDKEKQRRAIQARKNFKNCKRHTTKNYKAITNGSDLKFIPKDEILPTGWKYGNCKTSGKHNMSNYTESMREYRCLISKGSKNPMYGKGYKISGGNNGHTIYNYIFENVIYDCRKSLIKDLNLKGFNISESTIRNIQNHTYGQHIKNKYQYIIDNLKWELKDENKKDI